MPSPSGEGTELLLLEREGELGSRGVNLIFEGVGTLLPTSCAWREEGQAPRDRCGIRGLAEAKGGCLWGHSNAHTGMLFLWLFPYYVIYFGLIGRLP